MRIITFIILLLSVLVASAFDLYACSCTVNPPKSDVEFIGRVSGIKRLRDFRQEVLFEIIKVKRGQITDKMVSVFSATTEELCGFPFALSKTYLVKANKIMSKLETTSCDGNEMLHLLESSSDEEAEIETLIDYSPDQ